MYHRVGRRNKKSFEQNQLIFYSKLILCNQVHLCRNYHPKSWLSSSTYSTQGINL